MRIEKTETIFRGKYLKIVNKHVIQDNGQEAIWEVVERTNVQKYGVVVIVALTSRGELILERNYRVAIESHVIQLPAGLTDRESETLEECARRELLEETGYLAKEMTNFATLPMSPVLTSLKGVHFLARDVEYAGKPAKGDPLEQVEVFKVPVGEIGRFLLNPPAETTLDLRVPGLIWLLEKQKLI